VHSTEKQLAETSCYSRQEGAGAGQDGRPEPHAELLAVVVLAAAAEAGAVGATRSCLKDSTT